MAQNIVLVTGGNNGIGLATCQELSQKPSNHVIMASRDVAKGEAAMQSIKAANAKASISVVQLDIDSDQSISTAVSRVQADYGRLDTLINNAGICPTTETRQDYSVALSTNCISQTKCTEAFLPLLQKSETPRVIYVSSVLGSLGRQADVSDAVHGAFFKVYRISKAALNMLALCDQAEYGPKGIKVFAYCPGWVLSDLAGERQMKMDAGAPTPERAAQGLREIHEGKQDQNLWQFLHRDQILDGASTHAW